MNRCINAKIDDAHSPRPCREVQPIYPGAHNIHVKSTIGVRCGKEPIRDRTRNVKRPSLHVSDEPNAAVLWQSTRLGEIYASRQIRVDRVNKPAVEHLGRLGTIVVRHE